MTNLAVEVTRLIIDGPVGALEAMLEAPSTPVAGVAAVICHPHPQFQGTMLNKVVHTLSRSCTDVGVPALRFNYRGVGTSSGEYDDGRGETLDAEAAVDYMLAAYPGAAILLAGFSFGAGVALRYAHQSLAGQSPNHKKLPAALITVAPPVGRAGVPQHIALEIPWLLVQGGADELVDSRAVQTWAESQNPIPTIQMLPGVSHFFHGNLTRLRNLSSSFLNERMDILATARAAEL